MNWFTNLSIRLKILSVAGMGILAFLAYFIYGFYNNEANIRQLSVIEQVDVPVLESINQSNLAYAGVREAFIAALNQQSHTLLGEAHQLAARYKQILARISETDADLSADVAQLAEMVDEYLAEADALAQLTIAADASPAVLENQLQRVGAVQARYEAMQRAFERNRYAGFRAKLETSREDSRTMQYVGLGVSILTFLLLTLIAWRVTRSVTRGLRYAVEAADNIAQGDWDAEIQVRSRDETGRLLYAIRKMRDALKKARDDDSREELLKTRLAELNDRMRGDMTLQQLGDNILNYMVPALQAQVGAFYVFDDEDNLLRLNSSHAMERRKHLASEFQLGEGLVGQCALEQKQILLSRVPEDYLSVTSATGSASPRNVVVTPIIHEDEIKGVVEIAAFREFDDDDQAFLQQAVHALAIAVHTAQNRVRLAQMLEQTRLQAQELETQKHELAQVNADLEQQAMDLSASESRLQQQQEELKAINEELEAQAQALRASEESLQAQQEELRVTNEELEAQARLMSEQKAEVTHKNQELELLRQELEEKVRELELSSRYKSEFLSTMSHELRTPLNSILILSNALSENKRGNLDEKQVEHASVIHSAGTDLLSLINDILDISKIEEGKMELVIDAIRPSELSEHFRRSFSHVAENRGLTFHADVATDVPEQFFADRQRLEQIIKNMLSNALKFTEHGSVTFKIDQPAADERLPSRHLIPGETLRFSVTDTGIGIPTEKQQLIFEAFQQADGTTSRKYGGTGLGLTISRELARLLGGEIAIHSDGEGQGATFMLYLPIGSEATAQSLDEPVEQEQLPAPGSRIHEVVQPLPEDGYLVREKSVLIIEDDTEFAKVLVELAADYGLEGHVCEDGESGLEYARHYRPSAIILDIGLPGMDGWEVMERLKADPRSKDIPVHFLSGKDERKKALDLGAIDFLTKPVNKNQIIGAFAKIESAISKNVRRLLVVEDSEIQHEGIRELFDQRGVEITAATNGADALEALRTQVFDCMILDLTLPDMSGFELLEKINSSDDYDSVPVIIYTGKDLTREEEAQLRKYADRIILKTERSSERLLNEASLFLHWLESTLPGHARHSAQAAEHRDDVFEDKKLLLVDDDMRNIYALSAQLEELGFDITIANNGREALEALDEMPDADIVLMDIMMPEMDGYQAMAEIRKQERFAKLPILALTAKAMKDDRAKCIEAGANDYCSKPIDMAKLTSLMRVWLHK
ncbi:response regulator [Alcanivorax quisquiliarum]|uniref:histidine kinase n=1 Tax=Alcanivorax quisquiliarum TaxID=2933565 RepID=A0ABT0E3C5_9GAMM|nr:response regulator [Alcanivorax quisquiliarum]MCK0536310.1 response regulator [Alcanivorax quisquiliarum]